MIKKFFIVFLLVFFCANQYFCAEEQEKKITTRALYSFFNQKTGELVLKGGASIFRDDISLNADEIFYNAEKKEAFATGQVVLEHDEFILESGQLRLYMKGSKILTDMHEQEMLVIAQKHPKLTEKTPDRDFTVITAVELKFFRAEEKVEAFENVKMVQYEKTAFKPSEKVVITGDYMEYLSLEKRALVRNSVKLKTSDMGADGQRLIYYQDQEQFYIIGDARIQQYDEQGVVRDTITGNKLLHKIAEKRTILMGNIEGSLEIRE
jgi:lipopolysaccharide assembly outer membrane protein LptD (OstA)